MAETPEGNAAALRIDAAALRVELTELTRLSASFGSTITRAFASAVTGGRKLSDVLKSLVLSLSDRALTAALKPFGDMIGGALSQMFGPHGSLTGFAKGGVIGGPTAFPLRGGIGLAGEAGPEAILPLMRGTDGRLGVRAGGGVMQVTINISTPDVEGFRRSQSQVAAALVRALERGKRNL